MGKDSTSEPTLLARCVAETTGTFLLVFFGCGAVHAAVLTEAQTGIWQVAIVWAIAIMLAISLVARISGAHINPAITIACAVWSRFSWSLVLPYVAAQLVGAFLAAAVLFALFHPFLDAKEIEKKVERGKPGSEITAMCYGEYYPNPARHGTRTEKYQGKELAKRLKEHTDTFPVATALAAEVFGTFLLALVVFGLTDPANRRGCDPRLAPVFIGLTVALLISLLAPHTQACFNPARDFGPRLFACLAGWGEIALPGMNGHGFFTVYILAPIAGAILGGGFYRFLAGVAPEEGRDACQKNETDESSEEASPM